MYSFSFAAVFIRGLLLCVFFSFLLSLACHSLSRYCSLAIPSPTALISSLPPLFGGGGGKHFFSILHFLVPGFSSPPSCCRISSLPVVSFHSFHPCLFIRFCSACSSPIAVLSLFRLALFPLGCLLPFLLLYACISSPVVSSFLLPTCLVVPWAGGVSSSLSFLGVSAALVTLLYGCLFGGVRLGRRCGWLVHSSVRIRGVFFLSSVLHRVFLCFFCLLVSFVCFLRLLPASL